MRIVINDDPAVYVDIPDNGGVHVHDGGVIEEVSATPFAAIEAVAAIAVSVINASVISDLWAPVSSIPDVSSVVPSPITGGP
jgi:hypothetical protein